MSTVSRTTKSRTRARLMVALSAFALFAVLPFHMAMAQIAPSLGMAESFAVLGASTVSNTGPTVITGDLGVSPGTAITGFPPGLDIGATHVADAVATQAQSDTTTAYTILAGEACDTTFGVPTDIGGMILVPGVYCFTSSAQITGALTLDAGGDPNAVWVFKVASTLITASNASVALINDAQACNVFWQVGSSATIGTGTTFIGNILALTSITVTTNATMSGRALAQNGAVTMDSNVITISSCIAPIPPTVGKAFSPAAINAGGSSTLTITLSNANASVASITSAFTDTLPRGVVVSGAASSTCGGTVTSGASSVTLTGGAIPANGSCTITVAVTAPNGGTYINSVPVGSLVTSNGNNTAPAVATLMVSSALGLPSLSKAFNPATISAGDASTLTLTLSNSAASAASITSPLTDTFPAGVTITSAPTNTCGGVITFSTSSVTLTGGSIPARGSCTITVPVTAPNGGNFINSLPAGALQTSNGNSASPVVATLTVTPAVPKQFSYRCEFAADVKNAEISCDSTGNVCVEPVPSNGSCTKPNSLEITCDNGFKFSDHAAQESLAHETLQLSGVSGSTHAELNVFNFENVSDTLEASLQVKSDDLFLKVFGSCELTQLPLRRN